ncbi:MAG: exodeoxyribonuclease III [Chitinophagales bacterium]|nr:exodeoxyribonuclease III [Chitinophagales bacterium]
MKIISYNVNGIRAAIKKGLVDFIQRADPDIVCLQETKAHIEDINAKLFEDLGYHTYWHCAEKKGYSGVGILSKKKADKVIIGCGIPEYDREGRVIQIEIDGLVIVNTYFPSGSSGEERQAVKMKFLPDYFEYINQLKSKYENLIICGDYNICHRAIDIHNPVGNKNSSGFLPEERAWMDQWFDNGMIDSYRYFYPDTAHQYSWWSARFNSRANNKGWRIDYISVSEKLKDRLKSASILQEEVHSDHCPISLEIK